MTTFRNYKKALVALLLAFALTAILPGCSSTEESSAPPTAADASSDDSGGESGGDAGVGGDGDCDPQSSGFVDPDCLIDN